MWIQVHPNTSKMDDFLKKLLRADLKNFIANLVLVQPVVHEFLKQIAIYFPEKGARGG